ncbi:hypothetical protein OROGR_022725 [Orobanche gracilis]
MGGMGFRKLREMNLTLLGKQAWRLIMRPDSLVARVYKARRRVGDGLETKIGIDPWLPDDNNPYIQTSLSNEVIVAPVRSLMNVSGIGWNAIYVRQVVNERDANLILNIPLSIRRPRESWTWWWEEKGEYSVKSCYRRMMGNYEPLCSGYLPTQDILASRRVSCNVSCFLCNLADETTAHLFVKCQKIKDLWSNVHLKVSPYTNMRRFAILCWEVWQSRNTKIWKGNYVGIHTIINTAISLLNSWTTINGAKQGGTTSSAIQSWTRPVAGRFKLNTDAAICVETEAMGMGWVLRDSDDHFLAAKGSNWPEKFSQKIAEAVSIREALSWMKNMGYEDFDLELALNKFILLFFHIPLFLPLIQLLMMLKKLSSRLEYLISILLNDLRIVSPTLLLGRPFLCQVVVSGMSLQLHSFVLFWIMI